MIDVPHSEDVPHQEADVLPDEEAGAPAEVESPTAGAVGGSAAAPDRVRRCVTLDERSAALAEAVSAVRRGACVVLPTDTVYGIGADAFSPAAVQGLLNAKGRGRDMPPPVLIGDPAVLMALGRDIPDPAKRLAERFWPGALTLIVHAQPSLVMDLGDTHGTIAVRVPNHEFARELLRATGPLAVSSANRTGEPAAVTAAGAAEQLGDRVELYLDAGATAGQTPSTIVDFTRSDYGVLVRAGRVTIDELREVVPFLDERIAGPAEEPAPERAEDPEPVQDQEPIQESKSIQEPEPVKEPEPVEESAEPDPVAEPEAADTPTPVEGPEPESTEETDTAARTPDVPETETPAATKEAAADR